MGTPALLDRYELLAAWHRLTPKAEFAGRYRYELDELGEAILNPSPSARRQIVLTDVYCHLTEQIGHLAAMSVAVTTPSFGRRVESYLEGGAREVIVVGQYGQVEYWGARGQRQASDFGMALSLDRMYFEEGGVSRLR
jgi:hypothetical protein